MSKMKLVLTSCFIALLAHSAFARSGRADFGRDADLTFFRAPSGPRGPVGPASCSKDDVHGTRIVHYFLDSGTIDVPFDSSRDTLGAWVLGANGFTFYPAMDTGNGTFCIPGV